MLQIRKIHDARYCSSCKSTEDVYEIYSCINWGVAKVEKSIPLCEKCLKALKASPAFSDVVDICRD